MPAPRNPFFRFDLETHFDRTPESPDRPWIAWLSPSTKNHGISATGATELQAVRNLFRRLLDATDEELSP